MSLARSKSLLLIVAYLYSFNCLAGMIIMPVKGKKLTLALYMKTGAKYQRYGIAKVGGVLRMSNGKVTAGHKSIEYIMFQSNPNKWLKVTNSILRDGAIVVTLETGDKYRIYSFQSNFVAKLERVKK